MIYHNNLDTMFFNRLWECLTESLVNQYKSSKQSVHRSVILILFLRWYYGIILQRLGGLSISTTKPVQHL